MKSNSSVYIKMKYFFNIPAFLILFSSLNLQAQEEHHKHHNMNDSSLTERQHMIHSKSPMVMPFDMDKTTHYFIKNENGGILSIKVKDEEDTSQIDSIRSHLMKEQRLFLEADFRDPQLLHGADMPGLKVLSESPGKFDVDYSEIPRGAKLVFTSKDSTVINAVHKWFDAQLRDHGKDAESKVE